MFLHCGDDHRAQYPGFLSSGRSAGGEEKRQRKGQGKLPDGDGVMVMDGEVQKFLW